MNSKQTRLCGLRAAARGDRFGREGGVGHSGRDDHRRAGILAAMYQGSYIQGGIAQCTVIEHPWYLFHYDNRLRPLIF